MSKIKLLLDVVEDMRNLADSLQAIANAVTENEPDSSSETTEVEVTEQQVRDILVTKSQEGYKDECRALIIKHGATNVTNLKPEFYAQVLKEAEAIGNAT